MKKNFRIKEVKEYFYESIDGKTFETKKECEFYEILLKGLAIKCPKCNGCGYINERPNYSDDRYVVMPNGLCGEYLGMLKDNCDKCHTKGYLDIIIEPKLKIDMFKALLSRPNNRLTNII